jgi:hypothetical protein
MQLRCIRNFNASLSEIVDLTSHPHGRPTPVANYSQSGLTQAVPPGKLYATKSQLQQDVGPSWNRGPAYAGKMESLTDE